MRRSGNDRDATSALDPGAGQRAPSARPECEQRRHYCQGSKPDHFCGTPPGKHTEASIEKDCEASQTDFNPALVELGLKVKKWRLASLQPSAKRAMKFVTRRKRLTHGRPWLIRPPRKRHSATIASG